jgi:hypothetical protein
MKKEKVLMYQCPKCEGAAFYLSGDLETYKNGSVLNQSMVKQILSDRGSDVNGFIRCQICQFPFTTGVLYLGNVKEVDRG